MVEQDEYSLLKDLKLEIKTEDLTFSFCFWLYLTKSTSLPAILLRQLHLEAPGVAPVLSLNENQEIMLFPLHFGHQEGSNPATPSPPTEVLYATANSDFPLKKWVHIGCEFSSDFIRLYINGEIEGERYLNSSIKEDSHSRSFRKLSLVGVDGDEIEGYVHKVKVLPVTSTLKNHYVEDPPVQLSVDFSGATDIEEDEDGTWSIVGGKASCRRNFSLDVLLLDTFGQRVNRELEVVASLIYADNEKPVEKTDDAEVPLLTTYDGIEFPSWDRPTKLIEGCASFKLKISQLSSKHENRMFFIKFGVPKMGEYPFLQAFSHPINCVSRNRSAHPSILIWKPVSALSMLNGSSELDGPAEFVHNVVHEAKASPPSKRIKLGEGKPFDVLSDISFKRVDKECDPPARNALEASREDKTYKVSLENREEDHKGADDSFTNSENNETANLFSKVIRIGGNLLSDLTVFKYCLGSVTERSLILKDLAVSASEDELLDFAQQVSLYSGCSHHEHQITISKGLLEEGIKAWISVSHKHHHVLWQNLFPKVEEHFMKIARCNTRYLTQQDFELLRRIAGCPELVTQENFEKMWCWLYPVAFALSLDSINILWDSMSPKWIEGFITKEEAESSLQGQGGGLQEPGTFVLRFPVSRSWPHPDAGSLIVTYVGRDHAIHHSSAANGTTAKPLKDLLLQEPELTQLGRVTRSYQLP